jgi:hypothetical protein
LWRERIETRPRVALTVAVLAGSALAALPAAVSAAVAPTAPLPGPTGTTVAVTTAAPTNSLNNLSIHILGGERGRGAGPGHPRARPAWPLPGPAQRSIAPVVGKLPGWALPWHAASVQGRRMGWSTGSELRSSVRSR